MLKKLKSVVVMMLCFTMVFFLPVQTVQAKTVSKKSVTITLTEEKPLCTCSFKLKKAEELNVKLKVLSVSGKAEEQKVIFGEIMAYQLKDSLFYNLKTSKLKKNKTLTSNVMAMFPCEYGDIDFRLPTGMKKLKMKVTFYSPDGKAIIKSVKKS